MLEHHHAKPVQQVANVLHAFAGQSVSDEWMLPSLIESYASCMLLCSSAGSYSMASGWPWYPRDTVDYSVYTALADIIIIMLPIKP
jgi:hypothetical protein